MNNHIECSVALIKNSIGYLFSERRKEPFNEYYEFPGGKIEELENPEECLIRECYEELDIQIKKSIYRGEVMHLYENLSVKLYIFEIIEYSGKIKAKERQKLLYANPFESNNSFLESTARVLNRLRLRELLLITPIDFNGISRKLKNIDYVNSFIRLRSLGYSVSNYILAAQKLSQLCFKNNMPFIVDKKFSDDLSDLDIDGIHFTSEDLNKIDNYGYRRRQKKLMYSASCHNLNDIMVANKYNFDFIILSPVISSKYHKNILGWEDFKTMSDASNMPVFALGGIKISDLELCKKFSGFGVSGISNFWG
jgi:8-oxo-dGTP diphosphatase